MTFDEDLDDVVARVGQAWNELRGQRVFITGGTGFFGTWLLESLARANDSLALGATAWVLTRDPDAFRRRAPRLATRRDILLVAGDVRHFEMPKEKFSHVIHAATDVDVTLIRTKPLETLEVAIDGTRRVLEGAHRSGVRKLLLTSSGAVYGAPPQDGRPLSEDKQQVVDIMAPMAPYIDGKRLAELCCRLYGERYGIEAKIARCFTFVGRHLPLDGQYAIGNFLADALARRRITVKGDGRSIRSYQYASELAVWLWTILFRGASGRPYNVGSDQAVSIRELADIVARQAGRPGDFEVLGQPDPGAFAQHYVPSTDRARTELGLELRIPLEEAVARTLKTLTP